MLAEASPLTGGRSVGTMTAYLVTPDPAVAKEYDMHDEREFFGDEEEEE